MKKLVLLFTAALLVMGAVHTLAYDNYAELTATNEFKELDGIFLSGDLCHVYFHVQATSGSCALAYAHSTSNPDTDNYLLVSDGAGDLYHDLYWFCGAGDLYWSLFVDGTGTASVGCNWIG